MAESRRPLGPGMPLERTRWFVARAGARTGATAARFQAALDASRNIPTLAELPERLLAEAMDFLGPRLREHRGDGPLTLAVDASGKAVDVRSAKGVLTVRSVGPIAQVAAFDAPWAFLAIGLRGVRRDHERTLGMAMATAPHETVSLETTAFSTSDDLLVALITSSGAYQATEGVVVVANAWQALGPSLNTSVDPTMIHGIGRVTQLDIHPSNGNILVAAAAGGGVWRTDNGGVDWRPLMDGEDKLSIGAVAVAPSNPNVIYAASGEDARPWDPAWPGQRVYRSRDGGASWTTTGPVLSTRFSEIAVHPSKPNVVWAAGNVGLEQTKNGGVTWPLIRSGRITSVVIARDDPNRVYIGIYREGVFRTINGHDFFPLQLDPLLAAEDHGYIKLAIGRHGAHGSGFLVAKLGKEGERLYTTTDGGNSWTKGPTGVAASRRFVEWTSMVAVSPVDERCLYAGQRDVLKRTDNGGATAADWKDIARRKLHPDHQDLVFDPNDPSRIYLANDAGVYRSDDKGETWTPASGGLDIAQLHDMDITESSPEIVVCGAQESGIHYRTAAGQWRVMDFDFDATRVALDATDPKIVYTSGQYGIMHLLAGATTALGRIDDATTTTTIGGFGTTNLIGKSPFVTILTPDPAAVLNPITSRVIFLGGHDGLIPHLFRSTDGGTTWNRLLNADGSLFVPEGDITAIEFAPGSSTHVYLGTSLGALYRSTTGGATGAAWTRMIADPLAGGPISSIGIDPAKPDHVWVTFSGDGVTSTNRPDELATAISHVYKTEDGGNTWIDARGWFWPLPDVPTSAVILDDQSAHPGRAYVGTDTGVYMTQGWGFVWSRLGRGLPKAPVMRLRLHRSGRWLFAATMGRGVHRYKLD